MEIEIEVVKVLVVGIGMCSYVGVVVKMFEMLVNEGVNIKVIVIFEIKILVLIDCKYMEFVVQVLYDVFELEKD